MPRIWISTNKSLEYAEFDAQAIPRVGEWVEWAEFPFSPAIQEFEEGDDPKQYPLTIRCTGQVSKVTHIMCENSEENIVSIQVVNVERR